MYKETLDILSEDIFDPAKITIIENQLKSHFLNKTPDNKDVIDDLVVIVRRILINLDISSIVGLQPIEDKDNPAVTSYGIEHSIETKIRSLLARIPVITKEQTENFYGVDIHAEINTAVADEIVTEITKEILKVMLDNTPVNIELTTSFFDGKDLLGAVNNMIAEVDANWIILPPEGLAMIQANSDAKYTASKLPITNSLSLYHVGWLDDEVEVYCSLLMPKNVLIGYRDEFSDDTAVIYAPEVMLEIDEKQENLDDYTALSTRYAIFVNKLMVEEEYRRIALKIEDNG